MGWHGPYHRGAGRERRAEKRAQAEARNAAAPNFKRRIYRLERAHRRTERAGSE